MLSSIKGILHVDCRKKGKFHPLVLKLYFIPLENVLMNQRCINPKYKLLRIFSLAENTVTYPANIYLFKIQT